MDIQKALDKLQQKRERANRLINYYNGDHDLAFASEKFRNTFGNMLKNMRENLCQIVVDAPVDRMEIINFSAGEENAPVSDAAWFIWQRELMEFYAAELHKEAFKTGEAFLIVEPGANREAKFYVQDSRNCVIVRDDDSGLDLFGAKLWPTEEKRVRLNLYYPDRVEKYITRANYKTSSGQTLKENHFEPFESEFENSIEFNEFGAIPMFRFETESVILPAIPIQDRLNKTICDELVAQEFAAYPQRYATGLELPENEMTGRPEIPFKAGIDRLWFTEGKDARFGEFSAANLNQFLEVENAARLSVARVTGTPLHFFSFSVSDAISGEALKTLESRFTKRIKRTCLSFGAVWARAMRFALQIEGIETDAPLTVQWESPEQRSEKELLDALGKKKDILEVPTDVLREEYGYSVADIEKFNAAPAPVAEPATPAE